MPPDTLQAPLVAYGIVYLPFANDALKNASATAQWPIAEAVMKLQKDPCPDGYREDEYGEGFRAVVVDSTVPKYEIVYRVDDEEKRVVVIALTERRW